ncbi:NADP-dependent oxidoreductase [Planosporangium flavigriseum]|uniref:NADPH:quinone reductase n=1 Tax=Planosporangium flavigriseum TaxID=373681 RepID=A0A8J3LWR7_9ACTN|nr:NADP-dependent oxidoreductase [Planosporangium flavigriseum]NJC67253.1 NADP-dependent oxidoreductase [Planosporangium flavigriseum]GIG75219.1 NADPH:quinone reductase [Planosporangium flavigriseum]
MRAILVERFGGPDVLRLRDVPLSQPKSGEVLVRINSAGVGPWDVAQRQGRFGTELPYIPGFECAGTVVGKTGDNAGFHDGEPVYGYIGMGGTYADYAACRPERLAPVPMALALWEAGAAPVDLLTADAGINDALAVRRGQSVLVTAAAGGLGHLAAQLAVHAGAHVVATAGRDHHSFVHKLGVAEVVDHYDEDWPQRVRDLTSGGVDAALSTVTPTTDGAIAATRDGGTVATPAPGGEVPAGRRVQLLRYQGPMDGRRLARLAQVLDDGSVALCVSARFDLEDAPAAHSQVEQGHTWGKVVLSVNDD